MRDSKSARIAGLRKFFADSDSIPGIQLTYQKSHQNMLFVPSYNCYPLNPQIRANRHNFIRANRIGAFPIRRFGAFPIRANPREKAHQIFYGPSKFRVWPAKIFITLRRLISYNIPFFIIFDAICL